MPIASNTPAASSQSAWGEAARMKPAAAGPTAKPMLHENAEAAM